MVDPIIGTKRLTKVLMDGGSNLNIMYVETLDAMERCPGRWMHDRSMPIASSALAYMMLRPLPPSISTLVSRFVPMIGSTTSGYFPGCGTFSGWLV